MIVSLVALPTATAQGTRKTYAYIGATPNPVGINQEVLFHVGITTPLQSVSQGWEGLSVTITKPDGTTETISNIRTDSTGGTGKVYVPTMAGNYTVQTHFPEQVTTSTKMGGSTPVNTTMLASDSDKLTLVVQQEPIAYWPGVPLPTEYWTRPIDAELWQWAAISGSWLTELGSSEVRDARYNDGPETAHILWANSVEMGGLAGGAIEGLGGPAGFETGGAYEDKTPTRIIIAGILYYNKFASRGQPYSGNNEITAVDLHTGEELWSKPLIGRTGTTAGATVAAADRLIDGISAQFPDGQGRALSRGQLFYWQSYNYMGAYGILWTVSGNTWMAFDAINGRWIYTITDVPSGTNLDGPNGEILRYTVNTAQRWMALWNSSNLVSAAGSWNPHGNVYNASGRTGGALATGPARAWAWNITIPEHLPGSAQTVVLGDKVFGASASTTAVSSWAFSLKKGQEGALLFNSTWNAPADWAAGNVSVSFKGVDLEADRFVVSVQETRQHYGFSASTGQLVWGPTEPQHYLDFLQTIPAYVVDGRLISGGMSGIAYCYNVTTGELLWSHAIDDPYSEIEWSNNFPRRYSQGFLASGKYYSGYFEHSPNQPLPRGAPFFCLDLETGELVWSLYTAATSYRLTALIGDGIIALFNVYDNRFYGIGKGPSATTVSIQNDITTIGSSVLVKGMVTDVSPGTKDAGLTMRFPNGVPAVSDKNMSEWMQYVYMQFPRPKDVTGVEVVVSVFDSNNNFYEVGRATSDASGFFSCEFTPEVPGKYTVFANFEGSEAYYGSFAETAISVKEAPAATPAPTPEPASAAELYFVPATAGIIVAIALVGAIVVLMLRKR
jgi:outer membrane protein assembly factor BamB